jgi:hypothetical protein
LPWTAWRLFDRGQFHVPLKKAKGPQTINFAEDFPDGNRKSARKISKIFKKKEKARKAQFTLVMRSLQCLYGDRQ